MSQNHLAARLSLPGLGCDPRGAQGACFKSAENVLTPNI